MLKHWRIPTISQNCVPMISQIFAQSNHFIHQKNSPWHNQIITPLFNCKYCNFSCSFIYQINLTLLQQLLHMHTRKKQKETYIRYCIIYKICICTFQSPYMLTVSSIFYKCSGGKQQLLFSFISFSSFSQQHLLYARWWRSWWPWQWWWWQRNATTMWQRRCDNDNDATTTMRRRQCDDDATTDDAMRRQCDATTDDAMTQRCDDDNATTTMRRHDNNVTTTMRRRRCDDDDAMTWWRCDDNDATTTMQQRRRCDDDVMTTITPTMMITTNVT